MRVAEFQSRKLVCHTALPPPGSRSGLGLVQLGNFLGTGLLFNRLESHLSATPLRPCVGLGFPCNIRIKHNPTTSNGGLRRLFTCAAPGFVSLRGHLNMTGCLTHLCCLSWLLWTMITFKKKIITF